MFWNKDTDETVESITMPSAQPEEENMQLMETMYQIEAMGDMFSRMSRICFSKCVSKHKDTDLSVAEMTCVDRCVLKYMEATTNIGMKIREQNEQMQVQALEQQMQ